MEIPIKMYNFLLKLFTDGLMLVDVIYLFWNDTDLSRKIKLSCTYLKIYIYLIKKFKKVR